jgi:hypothetical protein
MLSVDDCCMDKLIHAPKEAGSEAGTAADVAGSGCSRTMAQGITARAGTSTLLMMPLVIYRTNTELSSGASEKC